MIKSVEEGINILKEKLKEFGIFNGKMIRKYGSTDWMMYDESDYQTIAKKTAFLNGMFEAFGLSETERLQLETEAVE